MKYLLTRLTKIDQYVNCKCSFYLSSGNRFQIFFDGITPEIRLNDGNFHSVKELNGTITKIFVDQTAIYLEDCFIEINGKWHKDGFILMFDV